MKTITLNANHEQARNLAKCLVGSELEDGMDFLGVHGEQFIVEYENIIEFIGSTGYESFKSPEYEEEGVIKLPIDKLVMCPYMCLKYQVPVIAFTKMNTGPNKGTIKHIKQRKDGSFVFDLGLLLPFEENGLSINFEALKEWEGVEIENE